MVFGVLGISRDAELVYNELVRGNLVTFAELARKTPLTSAALRTAVGMLEANNLVQRVPGSPAHYQAADPAIALDVLLLTHEQELKLARAAARDLAERYRLAVGSHDPAALVEVVSGREAVSEQVEHVARAARHDIRVLDKPPYAVPPADNPSAALEFDLLGRGGVARVIYDRAAIEVPGRLADLEEGIARGEQARILPELPTKLMLIDDSIAILPLQSAPEVLESAVVLHQSGLLRAISALFESLWQVAMPLLLTDREVRREQREGPTEEERRMLTLLTAGLPDDVIARELGLSGRTYQRRMQTMMRCLRAQTRFQLARQASLRGWLDHGS